MPIPEGLTEAQWFWLQLYCTLSGEDWATILRRYDVVSCACVDPHCKGWRLEGKHDRPHD